MCPACTHHSVDQRPRHLSWYTQPPPELEPETEAQAMAEEEEDDEEKDAAPPPAKVQKRGARHKAQRQTPAVAANKPAAPKKAPAAKPAKATRAGVRKPQATR